MMVKHKPLPSQSLKTPPRTGATKVVVVSLIAVVGVALLAGVGYWFYNRMQAQGEEVNYAWLPPDSEFVVKIDVAAAWNSEVFQRFLKHPDGPGSEIEKNIKEMRKELALEEDANPDVFESVTIGGMAPSKDDRGPEPKIVAVVRKKTAWDKEGLLKKAKKFEEADLDGTTYYSNKKQAMFFPDANTMVMGDLELVKDAIVRGPKSDAAEKLEKKFAFLSKGHIVVGYVPKDADELKKQIPENPLDNPFVKGIVEQKPYLKKIFEGAMDLQGGGFAVQLTGGVKLDVVANCASSEKAATFKEGIAEALADLHKNLDEHKETIAEKEPDAKEGVAIAETVIDTITPTQTDNSMVVSLEFSKDVIDRSEKLAETMKKTGFPKIPNLGGILPGIGPGGPRRPKGGPRTIDQNNLKQIGLGLHNYHDTFGAFPIKSSKQGEKSQLSWRVHILPYVDQANLYQQFHLDEPWDSEHNKTLIENMPKIYQRPGSLADQGKTTYLGIDGPGGAMENGGGKRIRDFTDGTSNTIMVVGVKDSAAVTWTKPEDYKYDEKDPKRDLGGWPGGFHALFGDGSVHFLRDSLSDKTILNLFKMNDGQVITEEY